MHLIAQIGGYSVLALFAIGVVCIAFAEQNAVPVEDDQFTPELPFPGPIIKPEKAQRERFKDGELKFNLSAETLERAKNWRSN